MPTNKFLTLLLDFANEQRQRTKVKRVYRRCIQAGKIGTANRIKNKYPEYFPESDRVAAMAIGMFYMKEIKDRK